MTELGQDIEGDRINAGIWWETGIRQNCDKYTVYHRIFINITLSMLYKYNHIDAFIKIFLESFGEKKF